MAGLRLLRELWSVRQTIILVVTPIALLPVFLINDSRESRCAYGLAIMAIYWITESLPLACTALLPLVLFPVLGLQPVRDVCKNYMKDTSMFGIGCLTFAIAVETSNLHRRVALRTLLFMGSNPRWLMLGFMLPTWFLSMWVNNTSATAMMIPIVTAVLQQLKDTRIKRSPSVLARRGMEVKPTQASTSTTSHGTPAVQGAGVTSHDETVDSAAMDDDTDPNSSSSITSPATYRRMCKGMSLCVAYAANIGGTGSVSGTSTNLIMQGQAQGLFQEYGLDSGVNFTSWMIFALPGSVICVVLAWVWLSLVFFGPKEWFRRRRRDKVKDALVKETILRHYQKLGPVTFAEKAVMGHFLVLVILWLSRKPPVVPGWGSLFPPRFVGDSAAAILVALSLYVFPAEKPQVFFWRPANGRSRSVRAILDWKTVQTTYPWGVLLLLGGGFALANACEVSGLSRWIGAQLTVFSYLSPWQLTLVLSAIVAMATEVMSNSATASLLVPILGQLAVNLGVNPLYFLFPCTIACSFAFMLPVATPPNAIVFATGHLEVKDMILAGSMLNVLCVLVVNMAVNTWGMAYFNLDTVPPEFSAGALTTATVLGTSALEVNATSSYLSTDMNVRLVDDVINSTFYSMNASGYA